MARYHVCAFVSPFLHSRAAVLIEDRNYAASPSAGDNNERDKRRSAASLQDPKSAGVIDQQYLSPGEVARLEKERQAAHDFIDEEIRLVETLAEMARHEIDCEGEVEGVDLNGATGFLAHTATEDRIAAGITGDSKVFAKGEKNGAVHASTSEGAVKAVKYDRGVHNCAEAASSDNADKRIEVTEDSIDQGGLEASLLQQHMQLDGLLERALPQHDKQRDGDIPPSTSQDSAAEQELAEEQEQAEERETVHPKSQDSGALPHDASTADGKRTTQQTTKRISDSASLPKVEKQQHEIDTPPDGVVLQVDTSDILSGTGPNKVEIAQYPRRSITAENDEPSRIALKRIGHDRMLKKMSITLGRHRYFRIVFQDPNKTSDAGRGPPHITYGLDRLTVARADGETRTYSLKSHLKQLSDIKGRASRQSNSWGESRAFSVISAVGSSARSVSTVDFLFDDNGWLKDISLDGKVTVTAGDSYLNTVFDESEKFPCFPEIHLQGKVTITELDFH
eukprot:CAMPEP_0178478942 /NCGR_PEP_ID=MMETSP0696-20121128/4923_1 /TAXON_ID=265572 /ORGANISM="Extubocellulus spinifer, Strain CCMP396" /LENGTH=506 /DNA_ID=CAMNT_0020106333 /DNA_START=158 /DNA_END=1678 /DNA_ORIENTATION=+